MNKAGQCIENGALNTFDFLRGSVNQSSVSVGPSERAGTVEGTAPGGAASSQKAGVESPVKWRSLALIVLAAGIVLVAIMLAGTYAYHRFWRTPEEVANQLAK